VEISSRFIERKEMMPAISNLNFIVCQKALNHSSTAWFCSPALIELGTELPSLFKPRSVNVFFSPFLTSVWILVTTDDVKLTLSLDHPIQKMKQRTNFDFYAPILTDAHRSIGSEDPIPTGSSQGIINGFRQFSE
jgi:hypothetical protein